VAYVWLALMGLVIGFLARLVLPGRDPIGIIGTLVLGVIGALLGGWLWRDVFEFSNTRGVEFIAGLVTAVILLAIYRSVTYRRRVVP
jgi:uncharacterized membrane protein YeaQ/YmgE (transglycosylase-associated protein family)